MSYRQVLILSSAILLLSVLARPSSAQVLYGSIVGTVTDASNAAVPGASVAITHLETNDSRQLSTNEVGGYTFSTVPVGTYQVAVSKEGFQASTARNIVVSANSVVRVNASLQVGAVTESVQVSALAASLQTDRAEVRSEFTTKTLENMPVSGRSYQSAFVLMPGISQPDYFQAGGINNPSRSMQFTANGTSQNGVNIRIDGVTTTNAWIQSLQVYAPAMEAIETVNVVTNSFDAEQGMTGGAAVTVLTKSGTNALHGSLFEYHQDSSFRARAFFTPLDQPKGKAIKNIFGGTVGGPIKKDKLFYFASWEGTVERRDYGPYASWASGSVATLRSHPNALVRSGNMSESTNPIYDPLTGNVDGSGRTPFAGNLVPASRLEPIVTQKILPLLPLPTIPGRATSNYYSITPFSEAFHKLDGKINWNSTAKLRVNGRFSVLTDGWTQQPSIPGPPTLISLGTDATGRVYSSAIAATYVASPNAVIDANFGYARQHTVQRPGGDVIYYGTDVLGIPGTNQKGSRDFSAPGFVISGWTNVGAGSTLDYLDPSWNFAANTGWTKGTHNIRFGVDIYRQHMNHYEINPQPLPQFTFTGGITSLRGGSSPNNYNSFADFLLGLPQSYGNGWLSDDLATMRLWNQSLYVRDQWQVSRKLTVSYGMRWEYYPVPTRANRGIERYDFTTDKQLICGVGPNSSDCDIHVSKKLFSPRVGFAFRPTETLVMRAGYSLNWLQENMYRGGLYSYPVQVNFTRSGANSYQPVGLLKDGMATFPRVDYSSGAVTLPGTTTTVPQDYIRGYVQSWNFTLQKSLGRGFLAQAGYVATRTIHQQMSWNANYGRINGGAASQAFYRKFGQAGTFTLYQPMQHMNYDSLQASVERRFLAGFQFNASYTWSKWMAIYGNPAIPIPEYFNMNRALANGDVPHKLAITGIYELPFGKAKRFLNAGGLGSALAGGWQINTLFAAYTGIPFSVTASATALNAPGSTQRADQVKASVAKLGGAGVGTPFFDTLAFASVNQPRFGNAGFNSLRGPGVVNLDLGLFRNFRVTERLSVQFRAEAFNAANTPHFANPGNNVSNMVLNQDGSIRSLSGFGEITSVNSTGRDYDERYFRLGLRISF